MVSKSFKQFQFVRQKQRDRQLFAFAKEFLISQEKVFDLNRAKFALFEKIHRLEAARAQATRQREEFYCNPRLVLTFLSIGRIVFVAGLGWCPVINFSRVGQDIVIEVFSIVDNHNDPFIMKHLRCNSEAGLRLLGLELSDSPGVISVDLKRVTSVSSVVVIVPKDLTNDYQMKILKETVLEMVREFNGDVPVLKLVEDIPIENDTMAHKATQVLNELLEIQSQIESHEKQIKQCYREVFLAGPDQTDLGHISDYYLVFQNPIALQTVFIKKELQSLSLDQFQEHTALEQLNPLVVSSQVQSTRLDVESLFQKEKQSHLLYLDLKEQIMNLKNVISTQERIVEHDKLVSMKRVVRRKEFLDDREVVIEKGRVASHIFGVDELLITEILLQGLLVDITSKQLPVLFSIFVNESKPNDKKQSPQIEDELVRDVFEKIKKLSEELATASKESGLDVNVEETKLALNPSLMKTISLWVDGKAFSEVCLHSDEYEGNIIRSIKRLYEMLKQLSNCADVLGEKQMRQKFDQGAEFLNRGIVFAASLYI